MTPVLCCGFECGYSNANSNHIRPAVSGTYSTTTVRSGLRSGRIFNTVSGLGYWNITFSSQTVLVARVYVRFTTLPSANIGLIINGGDKAGAYFNASDSKIYAGSNVSVDSSPELGATGISVTTGIWYRIDILEKRNVTGTLVDIQVDGKPIPQYSSGFDVNVFTELVLGSDGGVNFTGDLFYDDFIMSFTEGDYAIGPGKIISYIPNADGTHNIAGANDFERSLTGTDITNATTDAFELVNDRPVPTSAVDFINGIAPPNSTDYVEIQYEDTTESLPPRAVEAVVICHDAGGAGTNNYTLTLRDSNGGTTDNIFSGTQNTGATLLMRTKQFVNIPGTSNSWTLTAFNALRTRFLVSDASPDPYIDGLMLEAEFSEFEYRHEDTQQPYFAKTLITASGQKSNIKLP